MNIGIHKEEKLLSSREFALTLLQIKTYSKNTQYTKTRQFQWNNGKQLFFYVSDFKNWGEIAVYNFGKKTSSYVYPTLL